LNLRQPQPLATALNASDCVAVDVHAAAAAAAAAAALLVVFTDKLIHVCR